jgi:uncharacterized protein YoxC
MSEVLYVNVDPGPAIAALEHTVIAVGRQINSNVDSVHSTVHEVDDTVKVIYSDLDKLADEFHAFVEKQLKANRLGVANTKIVSIRQELDKRFGHYDTIRRHTTGILQATDLEIIRGSTLTTVTEELMLDAPKYWLAPCLVALTAWINNQHELADKGSLEGIRRDDEKASLFFALICRRAERKEACLKWIQRYLANQDEEQLDRTSVIILDAFASGLLGSDSEGVVYRQMNEWLDHLSQKSGFVEQQTKQWSDAINLKRLPLSDLNYTYLRKYSKTWPVLNDIMEGAYLHRIILTYFEDIFDKKSSTDTLKAQLDEILTTLVTGFDEEELPLRKQEKFEQFVIDFDGDEKRAHSNMALAQTAFDEHKDFTQLLTDAAMNPKSSHASVSTQKFAIALSKDWINNAYNDIVAKNRMKIPNEIEIKLENFKDKTTDGQNEREMLGRFDRLIDDEKERALADVVLSGFERFCLWGGIISCIIGIAAAAFGGMGRDGGGIIFLGVLAVLAGIGMLINHFSKKKRVMAARQDIEEQFEKKRKTGAQIIRATLAEVVDFRAEFKERDGESQKVTDFLERISPDQYVKRLSDSTRKIKVA